MAMLGADDLRTSEEFYSVIEETLACAECNSNIGQGEFIAYDNIGVVISFCVRIPPGTETIELPHIIHITCIYLHMHNT